MKIQIDTTAKTIKIDESVNIGELIDVLQKLLPKDKWKEFKLETNTTIVNWRDPIVIPYYPYAPIDHGRPWYWWQQPWVVSHEVSGVGVSSSVNAESTTITTAQPPSTYTISPGVFNIELKN